MQKSFIYDISVNSNQISSEKGYKMSNEKTKIRAAAMAAAVIAGTGMAGATNNNDKEAANTLIKETTYDNALKTAQQVEDDFKQLAELKKETKEGLNGNGEKLQSEEFSTRYGKITHYTFADGSKETEFFGEAGTLRLKDGKFYNKTGKEMGSEAATKYLDTFRENAITGQKTIFMVTAERLHQNTK